MVAKITHGNDLWGIVTYNQNKVDENKASVVHSQDILFSSDITFNVKDTVKSFDIQMINNKRTKKPAIHISLNPDPKDKINDETAKIIAQKYLNKMGYGKQPYILYRHDDIDRIHYHIVTVCVDEHGNKINDKFEKRKSMDACRSIEKEFKLNIPDKKRLYEESLINKLDYSKGELTKQMRSIISGLISTYKVFGLNEYKTLLELHGITLTSMNGAIEGKQVRGILYSAIDENGQKIGKAIKSSSLNNHSGYNDLIAKFRVNKKQVTDKNKDFIKKVITQCMYQCKTRSREELTDLLQKRGIDMVLRNNSQERTYGVTFVDHHTKTVINGSGLGKEFSANYLNNFFDNPYFIISEELMNKGIEDSPTKEKETDFVLPVSGYDSSEEAWKRKMRKKKRNNKQTKL